MKTFLLALILSISPCLAYEVPTPNEIEYLRQTALDSEYRQARALKAHDIDSLTAKVRGSLTNPHLRFPVYVDFSAYDDDVVNVVESDIKHKGWWLERTKEQSFYIDLPAKTFTMKNAGFKCVTK